MDSNMMMGSTLFNGMHKCGYNTDLVFSGYKDVCEAFKEQYGLFFNEVYYITMKKSLAATFCEKKRKMSVLYNYYLSFLKDFLIRPYSIRNVLNLVEGKQYDVILSFIPLSLAGILSNDLKRIYPRARYIQFWTDPLSLGKCNDIDDIPFYRIIHKRNEKKLLSFADKAVFCYPLLCEMEKKLHPEFKDIITWSDVSYIERKDMLAPNTEKKIDRKYKNSVGLFGSYHSSVRNIIPLLEVTNEFPETLFVIRGDSDIIVDKNKYPNVDVKIGRCPSKEIEELEQMCDCLLVLGNKGGIQIPGKVYYYVNYNKPLLCICDSVHSNALKSYLTPLNRYNLCDNNPESIIVGLTKTLNELKDFKLKINERLLPENVAKRIIEN